VNEPFFRALASSSEFCEMLGRAMLAASELESALRAYLAAQGHDVPDSRATLGSLTAKLAEIGLLTENGRSILELTSTQRNHFAHKLFDLLTDRAGSPLLPTEHLDEADVADVGVFVDYVWTLSENLTGLTDTVNRGLADIGEGRPPSVLL
jgi:hypothetical protein